MGGFDFIIVPDGQVSDRMAEGWCLTMAEAMATEPDEAPPTRAELEQKASELGLKFDGRTGDATLARRIAEAIGG
jgi:hypothetical protein